MLTLLSLALTLTAISGWQGFQDMIPNGYTVPDPCTGGIWDFETAGYTWTETLCLADSDCDNKTNGEELGDPNCQWTPTNDAQLDPASSHPDTMLTLLYLTLTLTAVYCYQYYQIVIPNGASVPNPCSGGTWAGVGHVDPAGAGSARNAFGEYFAAADHTWTDALCNADSDGDGRSNGEELGDPHCHWKPGSSAHIDPASGHPGICENSDGSVCASDASLC